jgi:3-oxoacyl-[acyl-carrier-protein] synthase III
MPNDNTPILIGSGLTVQKEKDAQKAKSPMALLAEAATRAITDAALDKAHIDTVAGIRFVTDSPEGRNLPFGKYNNIALSVARHLGIEPKSAATCGDAYSSVAPFQTHCGRIIQTRAEYAPNAHGR